MSSVVSKDRPGDIPLAIEDTHATAQSMYAQEEIGHGVRQGNASAISNRFNKL
ncbi:MAG: hypothetical protein OEV51_01740 [Nitrospira sp.]|nr:hypothetical protein [Nitrospira sp.]